jgi:helitron helicase-like protein
MVRVGSVNHILRCRQLFHQFIVDIYAKIESERLFYVRFNQKKLRVDKCIHLTDTIVNDGNNLGQLDILPSTFTRCPRRMYEYTKDAMTYVRKYGRPDLFITFTCNPKREEMQVKLMPGHTHYDRYDLLARVFKQKLIKLTDVITKGHVFGITRC